MGASVVVMCCVGSLGGRVEGVGDGVDVGAEVGVEGGTLELWLMLELENGSGRDAESVTDELYADGERLPGMGRCAVPAGESAVWPVSLPVTADGEAIGELSLVIAAFDGEGQIDELRLPVELSFTRPEG